MAWYRTGTATFTGASPNVVGAGTLWTSYLKAGDAIIGPDNRVYEILTITDDTHLTLAVNYAGSTASGSSYAAFPTHAFNIQLAAQLTQLVSDYSTYVTGPGAGKFGDGTAAAPGIAFASDADTGFYRAASNEIRVALGGSGVGAWNSTGLAVGTVTPYAGTKLTVNGFFAVLNGSTPTMRVENYSSGNTDITALVAGTTGGTLIRSQPNGHTVFTIDGNDSQDGFHVLAHTATTDTTTDKPMDTRVFYARRDGAAGFAGSLGIGLPNATVPGYKLDIEATANSSIGTRTKNTSNGTAADTRHVLVNDAGATAGLIHYSSGHSTRPGHVALYASGAVPIAFLTNSAERARFDGAGNFGIGVTSPTQKLDVVGGNMRVTNGANAIQTLANFVNSDAGSAAQATISVSTDTSGLNIGANGSGYAGSGGYGNATEAFIRSASGAAGLYLNAANVSGVMRFATGSSERMRLESDKLLVGATSATGDAKIQVANGVRFGGTVSADANTLDFYEEGTFTPTVVGSTTAGAGTYSEQSGRYTRVGNRVNFTIRLIWTAHTGTGDINVGGLPFATNAAGAARNMALSATAVNLALSAASNKLFAFTQVASSVLRLNQGDYTAGWSNVPMDTDASLYISGQYEV